MHVHALADFVLHLDPSPGLAAIHLFKLAGAQLQRGRCGGGLAIDVGDALLRVGFADHAVVEPLRACVGSVSGQDAGAAQRDHLQRMENTHDGNLHGWWGLTVSVRIAR
jgi:hypothetical protein